MKKVQPEAMKAIAIAIAEGNTCYIEISTAKVTIIDHSLEDAKRLAAQEEKLAAIEKKIRKYVKLEKLNRDSKLMMMEDFLDELTDKSVRKQLSNALKRSNPMRNFIQSIESDMELNQHWRNFRVREYDRWVSNALTDAYTYN